MADPTQFLNMHQAIVKPDGTPTEFFIRWAQGNLGAVTTSGLTMATDRLLGRDTAATGAIEELTLSEALDLIGSAAQGDILYRGENGWERLAAGTSGHFLKTLGAGANPEWAAGGGGGSGGWTEIVTHDFSATPQSTVEADLTGFSDIIVSAFELAHQNSVYRGYQVSADGGSSWFNTDGDYGRYADNGTIGAEWPNLVMHDTAGPSARTSWASIHLIDSAPFALNQSDTHPYSKYFNLTARPNRLLFGGFASTASPTPHAGNFTAGTLTVLGR